MVVKMQKLGPKSGAWAGITIMYLSIADRFSVSQKNSTNLISGEQHSSYAVVEGFFGCCAVERHICWHCVHHYTYPGATVKTGMQERRTECGTEIRCKMMNAHAHIVKTHTVIPVGVTT